MLTGLLEGGALQLHVLPAVGAHCTEAVVATVEFHHLQVMLLCGDFSRCEFTKLAAEADEASAVVRVSEDAGLEALACLFVCEVTYLHFAFELCKGEQ